MELLRRLTTRRPASGGAESYDQKLEQRAAMHESLRERNNATTCRSQGAGKTEAAEWRGELQRKRQAEFLRRRHVDEAPPPTAEDGDRRGDARVTPRGARQRGGALAKRQPFVSAEELGIVWPDVHSLPSMTTWILPPLPCTAAQMPPHTRPLPPSHQDPPLGRADQDGRLTGLPQRRDACSQTEYGYVTVKEADIVQLAEYLKEALWREQSLEQKLALTQRNTSSLLLSHHDMWKSCFNEDQMKGKIVSLESQLKICVQRLSREGGERLALRAEQERREVEQRAVAALQRLTVQKTQAQNMADSLEVALQTAQAESTMWRHRYEGESGNCTRMRKSLELKIDELHELQSQLELQRQLERPEEQEAGVLVRLQQDCEAELITSTSNPPAQKTQQNPEDTTDQLHGTNNITLWGWPSHKLPQIKLI